MYEPQIKNFMLGEGGGGYIGDGSKDRLQDMLTCIS